MEKEKQELTGQELEQAAGGIIGKNMSMSMMYTCETPGCGWSSVRGLSDQAPSACPVCNGSLSKKAFLRGA